MPYRRLIIIPAYNEEKNISAVISKIPSEQPVIIVDDGSTDKTKYICEQLGFDVISHSDNLGYEQALITGIKYFKQKDYQAFAILDADGEIDPQNCLTVLTSISRTYKVVVGSRKNYKGRLVERISAFLAYHILKVEDIFCGCKAFHKDVIVDIPEGEIVKNAFCKFVINYAYNDGCVKNISVNGVKRIEDSKYGQGIAIELKLFYYFVNSLFLAFIKNLSIGK